MDDRHIKLKDAIEVVRETVADEYIEGTLELRLLEKSLTADVRENVQLDVCPLYGGACGYPSGECYDCPRHGNFRENVRGEWISKMYECSRENYDQVFCCSVCGVSNDWRRTNFCPHCGADMRGEQDDESRSNSNAQTDTRARGMGATDKSSGI